MTAPRRIVLDAGPLIALLHQRDRDHERAIAGFTELTDGRAVLLTPLPIVFEVYKWLVYEANARIAREVLKEMRRLLEITYPVREDFVAAAALAEAIVTWAGTLEDAVVAATALRLRIPVWTLNYRDLGAFPDLRFWNPR